MDSKAHILLVEDEENFGAVLTQFLELHGFRVTWLKDGAVAYSKIRSTEDFACCVLDIMMPKMDGLSLAKELKSAKPHLPFVFLTAKSLKEDMIKGYKLGAADYITKPFDSELLVYKLNAILNLGNQTEPSAKVEFQLGQLRFNSTLRLLQGPEIEKRLSPKENALLLALASKLDEVVSREEILSSLWGEDNYFTRRSMDVYVAKLRKYLRSDDSIELLSLHSGGYQLLINQSDKTG